MKKHKFNPLTDSISILQLYYEFSKNGATPSELAEKTGNSVEIESDILEELCDLEIVKEGFDRRFVLTEKGQQIGERDRAFIKNKQKKGGDKYVV